MKVTITFQRVENDNPEYEYPAYIRITKAYLFGFILIYKRVLDHPRVEKYSLCD